MHQSNHRVVSKPLLSIAVDLTEKEIGVLDKPTLDTVTSLYAQLINSEINNDQCRKDIVFLTGASRTVERIINILGISDKPLPNSERPSERRVRLWSEEEDNRLLAGINRYGVSDWATISKFVGAGRSRSQCSQRWNRSLNPVICKEKWTTLEDETLLQAVEEYGIHAWSKIAAAVKSRTDVQCRYRYQLMNRKNIRNSYELDLSPPNPKDQKAGEKPLIKKESTSNERSCELWEGIFRDFDIDEECTNELFSI